MSVKKLVINGEEHSIEAENGGVKTVNGVAGDVLLSAGENMRIENNVFSATNTTYSAGKGIEIKDVDYSPMQGPCPDGFHIPTRTEWENLINVWTGLGSTVYQGYLFAEYIKLPFAGYRSYGNATVYGTGDAGQYVASTQRNANQYDSFYISSQSGRAMNVSATFKAEAKSIRPFKDSSVTPTSSWTKLYGTSIEAGGIFWDASNGLISLSSNGQTWITISDKNVGATVVWNNGDTLSESNCGGHFQWGNNYMFPFAGTVTTDGNQVDATNYGPWNYYSSSTFITRSSAPYSWDSSNNNNLRGGVTGVLKNAITNQGGGDGIGRTLYVSYTMSQTWLYNDSIDDIKNNVVLVFYGQAGINLPTRIYDSDDNYIDITCHSRWNTFDNNGVLLGIVKVENNTFHFYPRYGGATGAN